MPSPEEEKLLICGATLVYRIARAMLEGLDFMLALAKGSARAAVEEYDAEIRPHVEAIIGAARARGAGGGDESDYEPDSPAAV